MKSRKEIEAELIEKALKDSEFKNNLINNPKDVLSNEFNINIPDSININIIEEKANEVTLVIPFNQSNDVELDAEQLDAVAGGGDWGPSSTRGATCIRG